MRIIPLYINYHIEVDPVLLLVNLHVRVGDGLDLGALPVHLGVENTSLPTDSQCKYKKNFITKAVRYTWLQRE